MTQVLISGLLMAACCVAGGPQISIGTSQGMFAPAADLAGQTDTLKHREFVGTALYGYMNGGSDLYYEYGFEKLRVTELNYSFIASDGQPVTEKYTVEAYKTASPTGAFGLYSIHVNKYLQRDVFGYDCLTNYQLQGCFSDTYLSIVFENPTGQAREGALQLYNTLRMQAIGVKYELPAQVRERLLVPERATGASQTGQTSGLPPEKQTAESFRKNEVSGDIKLIQGPIALNNSAQDLYPLFDSSEAFELWLTDYIGPQGELVYRALVYFKTPEHAQTFFRENNGRKLSGDFAPVQLKEPEGNVVEIILNQNAKPDCKLCICNDLHSGICPGLGPDSHSGERPGAALESGTGNANAGGHP